MAAGEKGNLHLHLTNEAAARLRRMVAYRALLDEQVTISEIVEELIVEHLPDVSATDVVTATPPPTEAADGTRRHIYEAIRVYIAAHGVAPSNSDLMAAVGLTHRAQIYYHLAMLQAAGYITREPHTYRGIRLTDKAWPS